MTNTRKRFAFLCFCILFLNLVTSLFSPLLSNDNTNTALAAESMGASKGSFVVGQGADSPFGLNVQAAARYGTSGRMQVPLDAAKNTGAGWNREEFRWDFIEPTANTFDFGFADEAVQKSVDRGLNVLGLLAYNVDRSGGRAKPSYTMPNLDAWKNYVNKVVTRYKDKIKYWEIWNEPSDPLYFNVQDPGQRASDYAQLLKTSYQTIKGIDSSAKVITGGISGFDVPFIEAVANQAGTDSFDILGIHPYVNFPTSPEAKYWSETQLSYFMAFANRVGKPVWATEFGWNTKGNAPVDESRQGNYIARSYIQGLTQGLQKMFIYQFHDDTNNTDDGYGIVKTDWTTPKTSYNVYKNLIARLSGATFKERFEPFDSNRIPIEGFDSGQSFGTFANPPSTINAFRSSEQVHGGNSSLKIQYNFQGDSSNYVQVGRDFALSGQPSKVGFWVYGDSSGASLRIFIKDASNRLFFYDVGQVDKPGWQRREAWLSGETAPGSPSGSEIAYPIRFDSIQMYSRPNGAKYSGAIYIDDVYAGNGPNASGYRFERGGKNIDVLWADGGSGNFLLPTNDASATVFDRFGIGSTIPASNGNLNIGVNDNMIFVEHSGKSLGGSSGGASCGVPASGVSANGNFPNDFFLNFWRRYDLYAVGVRSYVWGEKPFATGSEFYFQALDGNAQNSKQRTVAYFDKSRMEVTRVSNNPALPGYVTNGLLTVELITGKMQLGDDLNDPQQYMQCPPAQVPVAGDPDDTSGPKYASLAGRRNDAPKGIGAPITETIDAAGNIGGNGPNLPGVVGGYFEPITNHTIAKPFWDFLNDPTQKIWVNGQQVTGKLFDPYYEAPGLPITEAYWAKVKVGGTVKDVLVQAFERRVLTYTPSNPAAFKVEWGNIGRHYYGWRYGSTP